MGLLDEQNFAVEGRQALRQMASVENVFMLRLELALIRDVGRPLINFCYIREGDGFLAPTTYNHWISMVKVVGEITDRNNPACPCVEEVLQELYERSAHGRTVLLNATILKGANVLLKLHHDGTHRLLPTLGIMRACRLWDYDFVANTALPTLLEEMVHLNVLPHCINLLENRITRRQDSSSSGMCEIGCGAK
jgi:hypothetical protein